MPARSVAERVAKTGMVGIVMSASKPLMVSHGSRMEGASTNPIAIAVPGKNPARPIILDMSTAAVAWQSHGRKGCWKAHSGELGRGCGWRRDDRPSKVKAVLPMSGPKGSGLSLMIEVLVSVLGGNPLISAALAEKRDAPSLDIKHHNQKASQRLRAGRQLPERGRVVSVDQSDLIERDA